ncbi:MAG: alpha/beta hydrolase, partial [bacterium]
SSVPNAMVFYYSCFDPTIDRWFNEQVKDRYRPEDCSPIHKIRPGLPPSLVLHGTKDPNCPYWYAKTFSEKMTKAGNRCELHTLEGAGHVFVFDEKYRREASKAMKDFLASLGYLPS